MSFPNSQVTCSGDAAETAPLWRAGNGGVAVKARKFPDRSNPEGGPPQTCFTWAGTQAHDRRAPLAALPSAISGSRTPPSWHHCSPANRVAFTGGRGVLERG